MKEYHGARMAEREELDGLDFSSEDSSPSTTWPGPCARASWLPFGGGGPQGHPAVDMATRAQSTAVATNLATLLITLLRRTDV